MADHPEKKNRRREWDSIATGIGIGIVSGPALGNIGAGIAIGVAIGYALHEDKDD